MTHLSTIPENTTSVSKSNNNDGGYAKVDCGTISNIFRQEIKRSILQLKAKGADAPLLVGILGNDDPAAVQYAEWTGKAFQSDGLRYELRKIDNPLDVERALIDANEDSRVHGIIVYYPVFGNKTTFSGASHDDFLRDTVSVKKDVEGLCHVYRTNLYRNVRFLDYPRDSQKCLLPCTALSVIKIIEHLRPRYYNHDSPVGRRMEGQVVTVINRSEIVGRPLAAMLANDGAQVYSVDLDSIYLVTSTGRMQACDDTVTVESCVRKSSMVVTGVPSKAYRLPVEWIQPNTAIINVASFKNVHEEALMLIPGVVYVPMVGKVTVAMLERNLMRLYQNFHDPNNRKQRQDDDGKSITQETKQTTMSSYFKDPLQVYTAAAVTALLLLNLSNRKT